MRFSQVPFAAAAVMFFGITNALENGVGDGAAAQVAARDDAMPAGALDSPKVQDMPTTTTTVTSVFHDTQTVYLTVGESTTVHGAASVSTHKDTTSDSCSSSAMRTTGSSSTGATGSSTETTSSSTRATGTSIFVTHGPGVTASANTTAWTTVVTLTLSSGLTTMTITQSVKATPSMTYNNSTIVPGNTTLAASNSSVASTPSTEASTPPSSLITAATPSTTLQHTVSPSRTPAPTQTGTASSANAINMLSTVLLGLLATAMFAYA